MEDKPVSPEPQQAPEVQESPEHMFVKNSLSRTSFLKPGTSDRETLRDRMGKIFPQFEAQVIVEFDRLKTLGENRIASKYEEDAKRRARIVYLEWRYEQRMAGKYGEEPDETDEKEVKEMYDLMEEVKDHPELQGERTYTRSPRPADGHIEEDDYSDTSSPEVDE